MLTFKEFIIQEGKISKALTVAGGVGGALLGKIPGVEVSPGAEVVTAAAGATLGNVVGDKIERLFKPKSARVKIVNKKTKSHIPDPKSKEELDNAGPRLSHQADPKPIRRQ